MKKMAFFLLILSLAVCFAGCTADPSPEISDTAPAVSGPDTVTGTESLPSEDTDTSTDTETAVKTSSIAGSVSKPSTVTGFVPKPSTATDSGTDSDTDTDTDSDTDSDTDPSPSTSESGEEAFFDPLREDYNYGTCKQLRGDVAVVLFFMDDFESSWTEEEIDVFVRNEIEPAFAYLEKQAEKYSVELDLTIKATHSSLYYDDEVITSINETGYATIDVLRQAAKGLHYASTERMLENFRSLYKTEEVVCFTLFDKNGTAYAINPKRNYTGRLDEHCIVFSRDLNPTGKEPVGSQSSVIAHEMLHLYGAEDYYASASRKALAVMLYPNDLMLYTAYYLSLNTLGDATAFYIGWTDQAPKVLSQENW